MFYIKLYYREIVDFPSSGLIRGKCSLPKRRPYLRNATLAASSLTPTRTEEAYLGVSLRGAGGRFSCKKEPPDSLRSKRNRPRIGARCRSCYTSGMTEAGPRYHSLSSWLKRTFGETVRKIALDAALGCPNRDGTISRDGCVYCNPRGSGTGALAQGLSITDQVDRAIAFLSRRYNCRKFIGYFQSFTNTYAEPEHLSAIYGEALTRPEVVGLAIGTRPDCVPDPVLDLLADVARDRLVWVEYGLQSIHTRTLESINRGHGPDVFFDAVERTQKRGIPIVVHLILGLPGESLDDMRETARAVAAAGVNGVKLHPLYVIRGTGLEKLYLDGEISSHDGRGSHRSHYGYARTSAVGCGHAPYDFGPAPGRTCGAALDAGPLWR